VIAADPKPSKGNSPAPWSSHGQFKDGKSGPFLERIYLLDQKLRQAGIEPNWRAAKGPNRDPACQNLTPNHDYFLQN